MPPSDQDHRPRSGLAGLFEELRRRRVIRTTLYCLGFSVAAYEASP